MKLPLRTLLVILIATIANAVEIGIVKVTPPDESEPRDQPFVQVDTKKVMLPLRTSYKQQVSNVEKSIWAVNFHETSNFNSVDLVVSLEDRIFILPNLWNLIESDVYAQKVVPKLAFDHLDFEITKIEGNTLHARFYGASAKDQKEVGKSFLIIVQVTKGGVGLKVKMAGN
jgi:hypothetical protein